MLRLREIHRGIFLESHVEFSFVLAWIKFVTLKALANEDTLLRTHCCQMFPCVPARATFVADTNFVSGTQKMFLILFRNILCPRQMFPSLHSPSNIMGNNVSSFTMALTCSKTLYCWFSLSRNEKIKSKPLDENNQELVIL